MTFGNPGVAAWGSSQWGLILPDPAPLVNLDAVCQADLEATFLLDALAGAANLQLDVSLDNVAQAQQQLGFAVDYAPQPVPDAVWRSLCTRPYVLVSLKLPGGDLNLATTCRTALGVPWDPRLKEAGAILRTIKEGTDDVTLTLDDSDMNGQVRLRDLFATDAPENSLVDIWLGAEGLADSEHFLLFEGRVEQVLGFSYEEVQLQVVRRESVEDKIMGELVDETTYPDAPPESVSQMLPIVYGTVEAHEGVVVNTNEVGTLALKLLLADTVVVLEDASRFPASGTVEIEREQISYTSIVGDELQGITRGVAGTFPAEHAAGTEVAEIGPFVVKFASHPLASLDTVKLLLPNGNLGDPVPQPLTLDVSTAEATWDQLPRIRDPEAASVYARVHFKDVSPGNTASNPQKAARENDGYDAFGFAEIGTGEVLELLTNTEELGQPGDIQRVWVGVLLDPESLTTFGGAAVQTGGGTTFLLKPTDTTPDPIARRDERTGDRFYDVPEPMLSVTKPSPQSGAVTPSEVVWPGIWAFFPNAARVVDKDDDTCASYMFISAGEAQIIGSSDAIFRVPEGSFTLPAGATPETATLVFIAGWELTPLSSQFEVWLRRAGVEIPGTRFRAGSTTPSGVPIQAIVGRERFEHTIDAALLSEIEDLEWVVHPTLGVSNGLWVGCELRLEFTFSPPAPEIEVIADNRRTVTNYFEVTDLVGASPGGAVVTGWDYFSDLAQGGLIRLFKTAAAATPRIVEVFYVVEYTPFVEASSVVPRTFANVGGLIPQGLVTNALRLIVESAPPLGLGLPPDRIDNASYFAAEQSLVADGIRVDFAVQRQVSALALLDRIAAQTDLRASWENGLHRIVRRPEADTLLPTVASLGTSDVMTEPRITIQRSSLREVVNKIEYRYRYYGPGQDLSATEETSDAGSIAQFGEQAEVLELDLIADDATAALVTARRLARLAKPRWVTSFALPPWALQLRAGDLIALTSRDLSFLVGEITEVNFLASGFKQVQIQAAVWLKG